MMLTSPQNPLLQKIRRAVSSGHPLDDGLIVSEGPHLLAESLASAWHVEHIFFSTSGRQSQHELFSSAERRRIKTTEVNDRTFRVLSDTQQNQGVLALLRARAFTWTEIVASPGPLVILDGIQDPGNAGAILRSTEAFAGSGVVFSEGCVRISNGKLLRAAAGSLFRLPFIENLSSVEIVRQLNRPLFALTAHATASLSTTSLTAPFALVVGSEGRGVSPAFLDAALPLYIPTRGVESLNAAVACSIALFEAKRQSGFSL